MPNIKSAKKRVKVTKTKTLKNRMFKTMFKTTLKKFEAAVEGGNVDEAKTLFNAAIKKLDQGVSQGILHKNNAARKKSQLALKLAKMA